MKDWYFSEEEYKKAQYLKSPAGIYESACALFNNAKTIQQLSEARNKFLTIYDYNDAKDKANACSARMTWLRNEESYNRAKLLMQDTNNLDNIKKAKQFLASIGEYKDAKILNEQCSEILDLAKTESLYNDAKKEIETNTILSIRRALRTLSTIKGYRDVDTLIGKLKIQLEKLEVEEAERVRILEDNKQKQLNRKRKQKIAGIVLIVSAAVLGIIIWAVQPGCMIHSYAEATCTEPKICTVCKATKGKPLEHSWIDATCTSPKICRMCRITKGETLPHNWEKATCTTPKKCRNCGKTKGKKLNHNWTKETEDNPKVCKRCKKVKAKETPSNGEIIISTKRERYSQMTIKNKASNCFVKLKDSSGNDVFGFFVIADKTVTVSVPGGDYYVYFAYGNDWYGRNYLFGENTTCSMDENLQSFGHMDEYGNSPRHLIYTLYEVPDGNLKLKDIDKDEF